MDKQTFLSLYRQSLIKKYPWAKDKDKLEKFMDSVRFTISNEERSTWNFNTDTVHSIWKIMGKKGKASLKKLRALP